MMPMMTNVATAAPKVGLFARLFGGNGIKWSTIINGTQKTLNILNQGIPLVKQVSPLMKNAKTMFRLMNEFKKVDTPNTTVNRNVIEQTTPQTIATNTTSTNTISQTTYRNNNGPTFFI